MKKRVNGKRKSMLYGIWITSSFCCCQVFFSKLDCINDLNTLGNNISLYISNNISFLELSRPGIVLKFVTF